MPTEAELRSRIERLEAEMESRSGALDALRREHELRVEAERLNLMALRSRIEREREAWRRAGGRGVVRHQSLGPLGSMIEVRTEENGHSATDAGGCACEECRALRARDGRCVECGTDKTSHGVGGRCCGCAASGLGA